MAAIRLPKEGPPVAAPAGLRAILVVDLVLALAQAGAAAAGADLLASPAWLRPAAAAHGLLTALASLLALGLRPKAMAWRRRLGFLAIAAAVWKTRTESDAAVWILAIAWTGVVWVALLTGGRALSRAVAAATGEEGLEADPTRPRL
jgi:hypothetical protein